MLFTEIKYVEYIAVVKEGRGDRKKAIGLGHVEFEASMEGILRMN